MLPSSFIVVAILLRLAGGASYVRATWQGKARPNLVSWFFWGLTALIACAVQIAKGVGGEVFVTLAIGISPIVVCLVGLHRGAYTISLSRIDRWCGIIAIIGVILWLTSRNPLIALYISILADIASAIPTIVKSYRKPHTENSLAYTLSIISMAVTLLTVADWQLVHWLFTAYILAINVTFVLTITLLSKFRRTPAEEPLYL